MGRAAAVGLADAGLGAASSGAHRFTGPRQQAVDRAGAHAEHLADLRVGEGQHSFQDPTEGKKGPWLSQFGSSWTSISRSPVPEGTETKKK